MVFWVLFKKIYNATVPSSDKKIYSVCSFAYLSKKTYLYEKSSVKIYGVVIVNFSKCMRFEGETFFVSQNSIWFQDMYYTLVKTIRLLSVSTFKSSVNFSLLEPSSLFCIVLEFGVIQFGLFSISFSSIFFLRGASFFSENTFLPYHGIHGKATANFFSVLPPKLPSLLLSSLPSSFSPSSSISLSLLSYIS